MAEDESKSLDILGLKPYADSVKIVTQGAVDAAAAFLGRICLPAAEEFGLLLKDKVSRWRATNAVNIAAKAEKKLKLIPNAEGMHAHPRLVASIIEHGSWSDDDQVQEMWAGLLASSCTQDGRDESNLIFINILSQLTSLQAAILKYCCLSSVVIVTQLTINGKELKRVRIDPLTLEWNEKKWNCDLSRMLRELEYLLSLDLIKDDSNPNMLRPPYQSFYVSAKDSSIRIKPTPLALHLYVRCQGYSGSIEEYFKRNNIES
jgi:abortive infection alpha-like protein